MGKSDQIGEILVISRKLRLFLHYVLAQSVDILNISAKQVSKPDMQVGCLLGFGKLFNIFQNESKI